MKKFYFDLQLFSEVEDEEVEDDGYTGEDDEAEVEKSKEIDDEVEEEADENEETEEEKEDDDSEEDEKGLDKKTKAIIKYKKEAKEAKKRLQLLEEQLQESNDKETLNKLIKDKVKDGYSKEEAGKMANLELENKQMKEKMVDFEFGILEKRFPLITNHKEEILKLKKELKGSTVEDIYLAKFFASSQSDAENIAEQRMLYSKEESNTKTGVKSGKTKSMKTSNVKLSPSDLRAYNIVKATRPEMTKKQFSDLMNLEEISE